MNKGYYILKLKTIHFYIFINYGFLSPMKWPAHMGRHAEETHP